MTGAELRAHRKAVGLSQVELAWQTGVARHAVQYWEHKAEGGAPSLLRGAGLAALLHPKRARGWSLTWPDPWQARLDAQAEAQLARVRARLAKTEAQRRVLCGAKTGKGTPCANKTEPGRLRCKVHGGKSTGPRTAERRARIAEVQRRRWATLL